MDSKKDGNIPTFHIKADSIPEAYWKAIHTVHNKGYELRTQYDRKDDNEGFIDPPGKDAKVTIEITHPFAQPRFPVLSYCEIGKYIAEFLGAKNHLVVPYEDLIKMVKEEQEFEATQWPYCYHQRLTAYPKADGTTINQLEVILDKLAKDPISRRAVAVTAVPEIDLFMKEDQPCLREIQLRAIENNGKLVLNMHANWRSRDLYKAWGDNLIGITNLQARLANRLQEKTGRKVVVGSYTETNGSLHIYGQDYSQKGMDTFFKNFKSIKSFIKRSKTSKDKLQLITQELEELKNEKTWKFTTKEINIIDTIIADYKSGKFLP
jgi:thymidylate synthase